MNKRDSRGNVVFMCKGKPCSMPYRLLGVNVFHNHAGALISARAGNAKFGAKVLKVRVTKGHFIVTTSDRDT